MAIEPSELAQVVEELTGSSDPGTWTSEEIHEAVPAATLGLWRVRGADWSVVVKLVGHRRGGHPNWRAGTDVDHWYYWRREANAYESGLLSSLVGGLRPPACYLAAERPDRKVALWLEDLAAATPATTWAPDRYGLAARHLGRAQGAIVVGTTPLPEARWLSRDWLRAYLTQRDADMGLLADPEAWDTELARRWLPAELGPALAALRAGQDLFLEALDDTPRTLCHFDLHPANLFASGDDGTVLIDWSFVGIGALGEDAGNLVPDAVLDFHVTPRAIGELYDVIAAGYLAGLRDAGWDGPPEVVDLAMRASIAAKYAWIAPAMLRAAVEGRATLNRRPIEQSFEAWAPVVPFLLHAATRRSGYAARADRQRFTARRWRNIG